MKEKKERKKRKEKFVDDGRVIANMDYEHITGYKSSKHRENRQALKEAQISRKERWAIYKAAFWNFMPIFFIFMGAFLIMILLLTIFWMR